MKDPLITQVSPLPKGQTDMSSDKILAVKFYCGQVKTFCKVKRQTIKVAKMGILQAF